MKKNFKVGHLNVRSLNTGFNDFQKLIEPHGFDIVALSETWLSNDIPDNAFLINGYQLVRRDRTSRRGGVAAYVSNSLKVEILDVNLDVAHIEQLWFKFQINSLTLAIAVFYRPPGSNIHQAIDSFESVLSIVLPTVDCVICLGDINVNLFNLNNPVVECLDSYNFSQVISDPTRVTASGGTLLDPIFVSDGDLVRSAGVVDAGRISDHRLAYCELSIKISKFKPKLVTYRDFKNFSRIDFLNDLNNTPWNNVVYEHNIDNKVQLITAYITKLFDRHAPKRTVRVTRPKAPWLTDGIKFAIKLKNQALSKYKNNKTTENWNAYKGHRNRTLALIRRAKRVHVDRIADENNSKKMWKSLSELNVRHNKQRSIPEYLKNVDEIDKYFASVFVEKDCGEISLQYDRLQPLNREMFSFRMATVEEVNTAINSIKSNAAGFDSISLVMIKYCSPKIVPIVTHLINVCLENNYFPSFWKTSMVQPVPKVNSPSSLSDLRPISLLPVLSKVLERIVHGQMTTFAENFNLIPPNQSGFRKGFGTTAVLSGVVDDIVRGLDGGRVSALVLLDYSKA